MSLEVEGKYIHICNIYFLMYMYKPFQYSYQFVEMKIIVPLGNRKVNSALSRQHAN